MCNSMFFDNCHCYFDRWDKADVCRGGFMVLGLGGHSVWEVRLYSFP